MLLTFFLIVCDGSIGKMTSRVLQMSWFEEWFCYFEFFFGKMVTLLTAARATYGLRKKITANVVVNPKLKMVLQAWKTWPTYVTVAKDRAICDQKLNSKYLNMHVGFWDNAGIHLHKPMDAELQSLMFSSYYAGNVAKGGIFIQLCGWLGTHDLYPGAMLDSMYFNKFEILHVVWTQIEERESKRQMES